jgi:hypothetical protein
MREAVGFAAGLTLGAAAVAAFTTEAGRRLVRELGREAEPDLRSAAEEWQPMLDELARAVRLGARELTTAIDRAVAIVGNAGATAAGNAPADADPAEAIRDEAAPADADPTDAAPAEAAPTDDGPGSDAE